MSGLGILFAVLALGVLLFVVLGVILGGLPLPCTAASAVKPGILGSVYRNTGSYGSPSWTRWDLVRSVTPGFNWDFVDASTRASRAKTYDKTQIDLPFALEVRADDADTAYVAMWAAAMSATSVIDFLILDGRIATEGAMGVRGEFLVGISGQPHDIGGVIYTTFDLRAKWTSNAAGPSSVVMGASSTPTLTAF